VREVSASINLRMMKRNKTDQDGWGVPSGVFTSVSRFWDGFARDNVGAEGEGVDCHLGGVVGRKHERTDQSGWSLDLQLYFATERLLRGCTAGDSVVGTGSFAEGKAISV
jgi:hypothetical protein